MARKNENTRNSKFVIRIVCEGDKTEPLFFSDLCNTYFKGNEYVDARTIPQPDIPDEEYDDSYIKRGWHKGKKRKVKKSKNDIPEKIVISGQPPLKWIRYARQILSEGVDEAWAVYDRDEHPKHKEAFEEASQEVDGKKVHIAFSSRSFEYYLLLHFEYLYYPFAQTECGERVQGNKHIYECGTGKYPGKDCCGKNCINGYARMRGYWTETKSSASTFPLVKDKLIKGMVNACRLRAESDANTAAPVYLRNPYTNADMLVGRLIGEYTVTFGSIYRIHEYGMNYAISLTDIGLVIENLKDGPELLKKGMFFVYDWGREALTELNETAIYLQAKEKYTHKCVLTDSQVILAKISYERELILLPKFEF